MEAKYPAILFKQQLTACVEKIFGLIRDNLKKEISPLLGQCIQVLDLCSLSWHLSLSCCITDATFDVCFLVQLKMTMYPTILYSYGIRLSPLGNSVGK